MSVLTGNQCKLTSQALTHAGGFRETGSHSSSSALITSPPAAVRAFSRLHGGGLVMLRRFVGLTAGQRHGARGVSDLSVKVLVSQHHQIAAGGDRRGQRRWGRSEPWAGIAALADTPARGAACVRGTAIALGKWQQPKMTTNRTVQRLLACPLPHSGQVGTVRGRRASTIWRLFP